MRALPLLALLLAGAARADSPSPLRLIPDKADFFFHVSRPRLLVELAVNSDLRKRVEALTVVKEQLDSTPARRGRQLLAYFERALGDKWPALLDDLAGGGLVLAGRAGDNQPALLVIQGKDEKRQQKAVEQFFAAVRGELERQESKDRVKVDAYHGLPVWAVGEGFFLGRAGAAVVVSNKREALKAALDLARGKGDKSLAEHADMADMAKLLPAGTEARMWVNMRAVQATPQGKELYKEPRDNPQLTVALGGYFSVLGRTPYLCAGLVPGKDGLHVTLRAPRGKDGMGADRALHVPEKPSLRPLLQPEGTLYTTSFYFDPARIWTDREKLFNAVQAKGLTNANNSGVGGLKIATFLEAAGAAHRVVVAHQPDYGYKKRPGTRVPGFALVAELREPEKFSRAMTALILLGGVAVTQQLNLQQFDEQHNGVDVSGYRFPEKGDLPGDPTGHRFNYTPSYARVGDQFIFSSTVELCKKLIDEVKKEKKGERLPGRMIDRVHGEGFAKLMTDAEAELITQTILDQAVPPDQAKDQVRQIIALVRSLGNIDSTATFLDRATHYDIRLKLK